VQYTTTVNIYALRVPLLRSSW